MYFGVPRDAKIVFHMGPDIVVGFWGSRSGVSENHGSKQ